MAAVFDAPMATVGGKNGLRVRLGRWSAGDAIGDFTGIFTAFFVSGLPLDGKSLLDMRKVQVLVKFGGSPDFTDFDPPVITAGMIDKIGLLAVFKVQGDIVEKSSLVSFNGEVIIGLTFNQVVGKFTLG